MVSPLCRHVVKCRLFKFPNRKANSAYKSIINLRSDGKRYFVLCHLSSPDNKVEVTKTREDISARSFLRENLKYTNQHNCCHVTYRVISTLYCCELTLRSTLHRECQTITYTPTNFVLSSAGNIFLY